MNHKKAFYFFFKSLSDQSRKVGNYTFYMVLCNIDQSVRYNQERAVYDSSQRKKNFKSMKYSVTYYSVNKEHYIFRGYLK